MHKRESASWVIRKVEHWPLDKQRHYLTLCVQTEKGERRAAIIKRLELVTRLLLQGKAAA